MIWFFDYQFPKIPQNFQGIWVFMGFIFTLIVCRFPSQNYSLSYIFNEKSIFLVMKDKVSFHLNLEKLNF